MDPADADPALNAEAILITGASGFIGRELVADLARRGFSVRAASRAETGPLMPNVAHVLLADLAHDFDARPLVEGVRAVVHLAGLAHAKVQISEDEYQAINAIAAARLAGHARDAGVERFVLMSSVRAQSGPSSQTILSEATPPAPTDAYGRSKLAAERSIAETLSGSSTSCVALRPVLVYGPGVKGNMAAMMRLARLPGPLPLGGLNGRRSMLALSNLTSAVAHALTPACAPGAYLVADDEALTIPEIIAALRAGLGRSGRLIALPERAVKAMLNMVGRSDVHERLVGDLVVDTSKFRATGWRPIAEAKPALAAAMRG